ncbi:Aprataxin [Bienertia sinuspersici]
MGSCASPVFMFFLTVIFLSGLSNDSTNSKNDNGDASKRTEHGGTGTKLWQKKKREEQYARLLKLFEEDDELEVELGLRD